MTQLTSAVDAVERLGPQIRAAAGEAEAGRRLSTQLVEAFRDAGLFRMAIPHSLGGDEVGAAELLRMVEGVSRHDGSAGWCVMISATSGIVAAYVAHEAAAQIFGRDTIACGVIAPNGRGEARDGGYVISGRWPFASGCEHSDIVLVGCVLDDTAKIAILERDDIDILDTWDVSGLRGTGSHDIAVADTFVAAERTFSLSDGRPVEPGPLYRFPIFGLLSLGVAAVALGIGRRAIDEIVELAAGKTPAFGRRTLAERTTVQADVARADALVRSARAFLYESVARAADADDLTTELRRNLRLAATNAARSCADAVDICYDAGGGSSIYASNALQRCFRDIHALTQHVIVSPVTYELAGRLVLGLDTDTSML